MARFLVVVALICLFGAVTCLVTPRQQQRLVPTTVHGTNVNKKQTRLGSASSSNDDDGSVTNVVLFGVGDLRVDDHVGLINALEAGGDILPLCILTSEMLANIPGAIAHTIDTANMLHCALQDLDGALQDTLGVSLQCKLASSKSLDQVLASTFSDKSRVRVHVCDLGSVDNNELSYGPYGMLNKCSSLPANIEIVPWTCRLRDEPWSPEKLDRLSDNFPAYEATYVFKNPPQKPQTIQKQESSSSSSTQVELSIPSVNDITNCIADFVKLDMKRCQAEVNTGLYGTHWGGLDYASIGCKNAIDNVLDVYCRKCKEDDNVWFSHNKFVGKSCQPPNPRSLDHAATMWQLRGKKSDNKYDSNNWLKGESIVRFLAAPLLFGTVSPRRVWHSATYENYFYVSPLKTMIEGREWHQLFAAKCLTQQQQQQNESATIYKYWRYQGFLCRYAVTDFETKDERKSSDGKEGVLLVHGFGASGSQWNKAMSEIAQEVRSSSESFKPVQGLAPDLIGFGQAEKPAVSYSGYMWDAMCTDFVKEIAVNRHGWDSYVTGGNSIGGFTSMSLAASEMASIETPQLSSNGSPGTKKCTGLVLMNSAGPLLTKAEVDAELLRRKGQTKASVAQMTVSNGLSPCSPPARPVTRAFGNSILGYLRPRIQSICKNLYPTNPSAVDDFLCKGILRDSLDPGAINVMMAGAKLPPPRTANELLNADFGAASESNSGIVEAIFDGPVLISQGVLDPLNDAKDRMQRFGSMRKGISTATINAGHCPHDELPKEVAQSIVSWMTETHQERQMRLASVSTSSKSLQSQQ